MSRDVFVQAFSGGDPAFIPHAVISPLVEPFLLARREGVATVLMADGGAEIWGYGDDGGLAVVGSTGEEILDLVVAIARAANAAIIPIGGTPIVANTDVIASLPADTRGHVVVVGTGHELGEALAQQGAYRPRPRHAGQGSAR